MHFVNLCPRQIAGTALAILIGINNLCSSILPQLSANEFNRWFVGLSHQSMRAGDLKGNADYYNLVWMGMVASLVSTLFILVLPGREQMERLRLERDRGGGVGE